jgi:prepilin-type processing-associated H-X9-DG protein
MQISITNGGTRELIAGGEGFSTFQIMSNELASPFILVCPGDSTRLPAKSFSTNFNDQAVSYFIGLDATDAAPQMFLSGDRNLTKNGLPVKHGVHEFTTDQPIGWTGEFHGDRGNIGLADGSVQVLSSAGLKNTLQNTGVATNRLAIP